MAFSSLLLSGARKLPLILKTLYHIGDPRSFGGPQALPAAGSVRRRLAGLPDGTGWEFRSAVLQFGVVQAERAGDDTDTVLPCQFDGRLP